MKKIVVIVLLCPFIYSCSLVYNELKNSEEKYIKHDTIHIYDTIINIIHKDSIVYNIKNINKVIKKDNKIKGVWIGEIGGMEISLNIFKYTGVHSYLYEFNATISYNKYRGYVKEIVDGNVFKMNVNGNHAVWNIKFDNDKIFIYQSGFPMFPTMDMIELKHFS